LLMDQLAKMDQVFSMLVFMRHGEHHPIPSMRAVTTLLVLNPRDYAGYLARLTLTCTL
jgi:hypothetical protein